MVDEPLRGIARRRVERPRDGAEHEIDALELEQKADRLEAERDLGTRRARGVSLALAEIRFDFESQGLGDTAQGGADGVLG